MALRASVSYLTSCDQHQVAQSLLLMYLMLDTLPSLSHAHLPKFLIILTPLMTSHLQLFALHLHTLHSFLPALIILSADSGPTPMVTRPFPGTQSFTFPLTPNGGPVDNEELDEEAKEVCKATLEFMISLSKAKPTMVHHTNGWVSTIMHGCLGRMGELQDDKLALWLDANVRVLNFDNIDFILRGNSYSQWRTPQTTHTRTCMNNRSTSLHAQWPERWFCQLRSSIFLACSRRMIGNSTMLNSWQLPLSLRVQVR